MRENSSVRGETTTIWQPPTSGLETISNVLKLEKRPVIINDSGLSWR